MRDKLINALKAHAAGEIQRHLANVEVYLANPVGIGEHPQHLEEMDKLVDQIATSQDKMDALDKIIGTNPS